MCAGGQFSMALTADGNVFVWGLNDAVRKEERSKERKDRKERRKERARTKQRRRKEGRKIIQSIPFNRTRNSALFLSFFLCDPFSCLLFFFFFFLLFSFLPLFLLPLFLSAVFLLLPFSCSFFPSFRPSLSSSFFGDFLLLLRVS